jgi:hypothetical protein
MSVGAGTDGEHGASRAPAGPFGEGRAETQPTPARELIFL